MTKERVEVEEREKKRETLASSSACCRFDHGDDAAAALSFLSEKRTSGEREREGVRERDRAFFRRRCSLPLVRPRQTPRLSLSFHPFSLRRARAQEAGVPFEETGRSKRRKERKNRASRPLPTDVFLLSPSPPLSFSFASSLFLHALSSLHQTSFVGFFVRRWWC